MGDIAYKYLGYMFLFMGIIVVALSYLTYWDDIQKERKNTPDDIYGKAIQSHRKNVLLGMALAIMGILYNSIVTKWKIS